MRKVSSEVNAEVRLGCNERIAAALILAIIQPCLINGWVFPATLAISPLVQDAGSYAGAAAFVVFAMLAWYKPKLLKEQPWFLVSCGLLIAGVVLSLGGFALRDATMVLVAAICSSVAGVFVLLCVGVSLRRISLQQVTVYLFLALLFSLAVCQVLRFTGLGPIPAVIGSSLCLIGAYLLVRPLMVEDMASIAASAPPEELGVTNPFAYVSISHPLVVTVFLLNLACGYALANNLFAASPISQDFLLVPTLLILGLFVAGVMRPSVNLMWGISVLVVLAGLFFLPCGMVPSITGDFALSSSYLLHSGSNFGTVFFYMLVCRLGSRNRSGAFVATAFLYAASWLGIGLGSLTYSALSAYAPDQLEARLAVFAVISLAFCAYNILALRKFDFDASIQEIHQMPEPARTSVVREGKTVAAEIGEQPHADGGSHLLQNGLVASDVSAGPLEEPRQEGEQAEAAFGRPTLEQACQQLATKYDLTQRELEVMELLACGRTSSVVQERLVLSRNTVKTHVRHIYQKLGIHSQQELIDLVEGQ